MLARLLAWLRGWWETPATPAPIAPPPEAATARGGEDARFRACLAEVLQHEGGWVNHPADPGGMTNLGITQRTLTEWLGRTATERDIKALTPETVAPIYRARYWRIIRGDDLPPGLDLAVFDLAVNSGPGRAARMLQALVGAPEDGVIGPKTLAAVAADRRTAAELAASLCDDRMDYLQSLPTWGTFGKGWTRRVDSVRVKAREMATG